MFPMYRLKADHSVLVAKANEGPEYIFAYWLNSVREKQLATAYPRSIWPILFEPVPEPPRIEDELEAMLEEDHQRCVRLSIEQIELLRQAIDELRRLRLNSVDGSPDK